MGMEREKDSKSQGTVSSRGKGKMGNIHEKVTTELTDFISISKLKSYLYIFSK